MQKIRLLLVWYCPYTDICFGARAAAIMTYDNEVGDSLTGYEY